MGPAEFAELVLSNPVNAEILDRGPALAASDWWLTGGAVFQTVWTSSTADTPAPELPTTTSSTSTTQIFPTPRRGL